MIANYDNNIDIKIVINKNDKRNELHFDSHIYIFPFVNSSELFYLLIYWNKLIFILSYKFNKSI